MKRFWALGLLSPANPDFTWVYRECKIFPVIPHILHSKCRHTALFFVYLLLYNFYLFCLVLNTLKVKMKIERQIIIIICFSYFPSKGGMHPFNCELSHWAWQLSLTRKALRNKAGGTLFKILPRDCVPCQN